MYGLEALRRLRERQQAAAERPAEAASPLADVPPDAPYDEPEAVLHAWNGERFVPYRKWRATNGFVVTEPSPDAVRLARIAGSICVAATCGGVRIWLVKQGERWLMYAGSPKARNRRRDFASPSLAHAIRTAEHWYGTPSEGWETVRERNAELSTDEAADLPARDSAVQEQEGL